jgi:hypothetical protein
MNAPRLWPHLHAFWGWSPAQGDRVWRAICASRWSAVSDWRRQFCFHATLTLGHSPEAAARQLLHGLCAPQTLVDLLENLVREQRLDRSTATALEDALFVAVGPTGCWCDHKRSA